VDVAGATVLLASALTKTAPRTIVASHAKAAVGGFPHLQSLLDIRREAG
jgi:hypothetical protein